MKFSKGRGSLLLCLLVSLNILIRIPSVPHPVGDDGFANLAMANSISFFGYAKWWIHPLSVIGSYPYSYASGFPFLISGTSQCVGIGIELLIWFYCISISIFSVFIAYLAAGEIIDDDLFKFSVAFGFSIAPAVLAYTSWTTEVRGFYIVMLLLFLYVLLKCRNSLKYWPLLFLIIPLLFSIHHYSYFIVPIFVSYFIVILSFKLREHFRSVDIPKKLIPIIPLIGFFSMYSIPFFTRHFIEGSRYPDLINYFRYTGFWLIFSIAGLFYLIFKQDKKQGEWFILLLLISFTPFICKQTYMKFFLPVFLILLAGIGLKNALELSLSKEMKKYVTIMAVILLLLSISFSGFYQHWRTHVGGASPSQWYMEDTSYTGALWVKDNIDSTKKLTCNQYLTGRRIFAISEVPTFLWDTDVCLLTYGFATTNDIKLYSNSPLTEEFYMDAPYIDISSPNIKWYAYNIWFEEVDSQFVTGIIDRFNISYAIYDNNFPRETFYQSIEKEKKNLYDNGRIQVWSLD